MKPTYKESEENLPSILKKEKLQASNRKCFYISFKN